MVFFFGINCSGAGGRGGGVKPWLGGEGWASTGQQKVKRMLDLGDFGHVSHFCNMVHTCVVVKRGGRGSSLQTIF
jgi:hypothetical protein